MNKFQFLRLLNMIYGKAKIDNEYIEKLGLLAVKIAQVHALRADFLPADKCTELTKLYRSTIPIPTEKVLENVDTSIFKHIERKPLASASVGQVHLAELNSGEKVIVKVIKNNFKKQFVEDVKSVKNFFKFAIFFYPKLKRVFDPVGIIEHIEEYTLRELNLKLELEGHNILKQVYEENKNSFDLSKMAFPEIYENYSSEDILVSEYIEGKTIDELLTLKKLDYDYLLELFKIHGYLLFNVGTFHGHLHPGNLIIKDDLIYFVDTGAIGYSNKKLREGLFHFFEYLSVYDYEESSKALHDMSEIQLTDERFNTFQKNFYSLYSDFKNSSVKKVSLTKKMMDTIKLGVNSGMQFDKGMFPIIKSLMFLDGMVLRCNPDAILIKDLHKFIKEFKIGE